MRRPRWRAGRQGSAKQEALDAAGWCFLAVTSGGNESPELLLPIRVARGTSMVGILALFSLCADSASPDRARRAEEALGRIGEGKEPEL